MSAAHILGMTSGTWTEKQFTCPKCSMNYVATWEQDPDAKPGSFNCTDCKTEIIRWSGIEQYFGWKQSAMKSTRPGSKI
jgi:transcription elongation factor Elf1